MKIKNAFKLAPKQSRRLPTEYFTLANVRFEGQVVGYLAGRPIRETATDGGGLRYRFVGVAARNAAGGPDVQSLRKGEWIVQPGLVYASIDDAPASIAPADRAA
ncbi:hypothetical protein AC244_05870 [Ensifer adhaerens]|uniref:Uncharacterized protein n=1 Tax=Ensifer adhaerens TaxID=106592 RepID=A0A0L8C1X0_ENSAD|nr:hypothetical protein AC244_05870 [Ensifer adhaerens]